MSDSKPAAPPYMQFWSPLSLGEMIKILRSRKHWSTYQLASHMRKLPGNTANIGAYHDLVKRAENSDPELLMSELVTIGEALGVGWDVSIKRNAPQPVEKTDI